MLPRPLVLPTFPWDLLGPAKERAARHVGGICDLSVGTPVDPTPTFLQEALSEASDAHGYPSVDGSRELREAILMWGRRRGMVDVGEEGVIPTIGSKEAVAWIPFLLGVGPQDTVLVPELAYPTYDIGARLGGATPVPVDPRRPDTWPDAALVYVNSPSNPDGHVLGIEELHAARLWAKAHGAVLVSDECYAALAWAQPWASEGVPSLLDERVCQGDPSGLLVLYSLSKQSNFAGYRAGLMYGDPGLVRPILQARKHAGLMVPAPIQHAMAVALGDTQHVLAQREVYAARRARLLAAVEAAGLISDPDSVAGLYLWVRSPKGLNSWELVDAFARMGILVAPGDFYGDAAHGWVRIALTASDERIEAAASRLGANVPF